MKKTILSIFLLSLSMVMVVQCNKATVNNSGEPPLSSQSKPDSAAIDYSAPPNASFTAEEVTVKAKGFTLAGTLLLPKNGARPFPAVITITGSGQQTRDEPIPLPGLEKYKPFRQVAETLASRGIAVLRVDDRGVGGSGGRDALMTATTVICLSGAEPLSRLKLFTSPHEDAVRNVGILGVLLAVTQSVPWS